MKNKVTKTIPYIAQAQLIGCILVIIGHSIPLDWEIPNMIYILDVFLYTFHMPLFFFISGYLFEKTDSAGRYKFGQYFLTRSRKLMLPYVVLTLIGIVPKLLLQNSIDNGVRSVMEYLVKSIFVPRENVWGHFWFLPTLLIISTFAFIFSKIKNSKNKYAFVFIVIILFALPTIPSLTQITDWFAINDVVKFTCYYAFGVLFANSGFEKVFCDKKANKLMLLLLPVSVGLFLIKSNNAIITNLVRETVGVFMLLFVLAFAQQFNIMDTRAGNFLTKKTYSIFILSWPFQSVVSIVFENMLGLEYNVTMPIAFAFGIGGPIVTIVAVDWFEKKTGKRIISPIIGG